MKNRFFGVVIALFAITVAFAGIVLTIAAIQDYQENKGLSFIERAASIVGMGLLVEEDAQVKVDIDEPEKRSSDPPDVFRFFGQHEDREEWLDDLFERRRLDREDSFRFEDRVERVTPFEGFLRLPSDRWEFEGPLQTKWIDQLVERGFMTEEDADEFKSWFNNLPNEFDERIPDFSGDREFEFDSDDGRFRFRWRLDKPDDDWFFETNPEHDQDDKNGV